MSDKQRPRVPADRSGSSRLIDLHREPVAERRQRIERAAGLPAGTLDQLDAGLDLEDANALVENVIGLYALPFAVATNFRIDGTDRLVPMVVEEPSVVAAASNAARMARSEQGFVTEADAPVTVAQVELLEVPDESGAIAAITRAEAEIGSLCDAGQRRLTALGGGFRGIDVRRLGEPGHLVAHLRIDCRDAMGANTVNTIAERVAPRLAELSGGRYGLRILSNLADQRLARARCRIETVALGRGRVTGQRVRDGVVAASRFAELDPYRAATHNKGVMNGIDAVAVATGNDWRGVEAGAHAYAARDGQYRPLTQWRVDHDDSLIGTITVPLAVGTVGGSTGRHPAAALARRLLGVERAPELARIMAAVGLAQNLAALAALATEGIQRGHMALHERARSLETDEDP